LNVFIDKTISDEFNVINGVRRRSNEYSGVTVETAIGTGIAPSARHHLPHPTLRALRPAIDLASANCPSGEPACARALAACGAPALRAASSTPTA